MNIEQAIILVAGEGKRLKPLTDTIPKCLVPVKGVPILQNALTALAGVGVRRVRLVIGSLADVVQKTIGPKFAGMTIDYILNKDYAATNSMLSLHMGLEGISEGTWVLEGDGFFEHAALSRVTTDDICWLADSEKPDMTGAFIMRNRDGYATGLEIIRTVTEKATGPLAPCKSIGVLRLTATGVAKFKEWLALGVKEEKTNLYYDLIVREHIGTYPIRIGDVAGYKWFEIDDFDDIKRAEAIFA